jgi:hypothetical protein
LAEGYEALISNGGTAEASAVLRRYLPRKPGPASIPRAFRCMVSSWLRRGRHRPHARRLGTFTIDVSLDELRKGMVEPGLLTPPFDATQLTAT